MSTLKAVNIQHPSASTPAITLDSAGAMTGSFPYPNRNLLYNGAMQINQRSSSVTSITVGGYYTADRWEFAPSSFGTWTQDIQNDAPTGSGFRRSLRLLCTSAAASPTSGAFLLFSQKLEGQDLQRIAKGTVNAQQLVLSFWVKSNVTGTFICEINDRVNGRRVSSSYTISSSATWERKTIAFPADTIGTLDNDNLTGVTVGWWLGAGSDFAGGSPLQTSWGTGTNNRASGVSNLASSINNYWQITGVQLETGSVATPFEFKSYGQELRECQRYYFRYTTGGDSVNARIPGIARMSSSTTGYVTIFFPTTMRARPSSFEANQFRITDNQTFDTADCTLTMGAERGTDAAFFSASTTGGAAGGGYSVFVSGLLGYFAMSAEL